MSQLEHLLHNDPTNRSCISFAAAAVIANDAADADDDTPANHSDSATDHATADDAAPTTAIAVADQPDDASTPRSKHLASRCSNRTPPYSYSRIPDPGQHNSDIGSQRDITPGQRGRILILMVLRGPTP